MPEKEYTKIRPRLSFQGAPRKRSGIPEYAELFVSSTFSFLCGASQPEELVQQAAHLGLSAIGLTDCNTLAGAVRAHTVAKECKIPFLLGCRLALQYEAEIKEHSLTSLLSILVYPLNRSAYGRLCRLLTIGNRRAPKGQCFLTLDDFLAHSDDLALILVPPAFLHHAKRIHPSEEVNFLAACRRIKENLREKHLLSLALVKTYGNQSQQHLQSALQIAARLEVSVVASNNIHYHSPERKALQDVVTCIKHGCTISQAGFLLQQNSEAFLKDAQEMARLFRDTPQALRRSIEIKEMAQGFSLDQLRYEYPDEICPGDKPPLQYLTELTWKGASQRFPEGISEKVKALIEEELQLIKELNYAKYFLTCYDIVAFARSREILCQGRGAAANSAVCYCLGITSVDPTRIDLLFARFVSKERQEPPDIDIDFEHERREEVIQYIYEKYGRDRAGLTCEVVSYRHRSAIRETAKALGLSLEIADKLAKCIHRWTGYGIPGEDLKEIGLDPQDPTILKAIELSNEVLGFPRHLSQHVGGFVISAQPLCETVPILNASMEDRTIIEWDKDDIEALGMLKIDILGLGMLTCVRKALALVNVRRSPDAQVEFFSIPAEDKAVYEMICQADTIGVFQIESRAQMSMLPRLKPNCFYDLVIEVAIVRPGPIQGNMVHPYLKRRHGIEEPHYPDERVKSILGKTLGVPLFQEQAMRLAIVLAQFTPDEAEALRRAIGAWKRDKNKLATFHRKIIAGMTANGYSLEFAESCMSQIKGFSEYGFPESHAASFALIAYASAWLKLHYPAEFAAALINSQPMGFYQPSQLITDAKNHGVDVLPIDVNKSCWDCTMEGGSLRLGMRLVRGLRESQVALITNAVKTYGSFSSIEKLWNMARSETDRLRKASLQALARADAFRSLGLSARDALWHIRALPPEPLPMDHLTLPFLHQQQVQLPFMSKQQVMFQDYEATGLSLRGHPIGFIRPHLEQRGVIPAQQLKILQVPHPRSRISVAGIAIVRQRPGTAKGVVFITLEDETGISNLIIRPEVFEAHYKIIVSSACILAHGTLQRTGEVVYLSTERVESLDSLVLEQREVSLPSKSYSY
ncbi:MAG: error-prone DNA polymerase [Deltaproteobacteria bacterium]|nr:error-prone DNA polymerase [Deltaproteobacteria bacterium]